MPDEPAQISMPYPGSIPEVGIHEPETQWFRASDGIDLFCRLWRGGQGAAVLVYVHGIEGHGQWFEQTASYLHKNGMSIYAPDRRGAGKTAGDRGDIADYRQWIEDLKLLLKKVKQEHDGDPLFLVGSCWGGRLAVAALREPEIRRLDLSGLVLISPALEVLVDLDFWTKLAIGWSWLTRSRRVFPLPITADMFTDEPDYINFIERDPLRLTEVTASFFVENLKLSRIAREEAARLTLPLLVLQSGRDRIVDLEGIEAWFSRTVSADKQMYVFSSSEHCLDFDPHAAEYARCLAEWLLSHGSAGSAHLSSTEHSP